MLKDKEKLKQYQKEYSLKNKEKLQKYRKEYSEVNKENIFLAKKKYREENKELVAIKKQEYAKQHKDQLTLYRKNYRLTNLEKERKQARERKRLRYQTDTNFKIRHNLRTRIWSALNGLKKSNKLSVFLGCTLDEFKTYLSTKFTDGMSWENYGQWHIDHIIPCAKFDLSEEVSQRECFHYTNLQPLWAIDNLRKGDK